MSRGIKRPEWAGRTVVCIASGPSLTPEDCETVHASGHPVIVTNTTFRLAPWADVVFGFDSIFWRVYHKEISANCTGRFISPAQMASKYGVETTYGTTWFTGFSNSGACAISLAVAGGAKTVVLIGFDCQKTGGRTHWHGDHPKGLSNAQSIAEWPKRFSQVAKYANSKGCRVINASRETALKCFERRPLDEALIA